MLKQLMQVSSDQKKAKAVTKKEETPPKHEEIPVFQRLTTKKPEPEKQQKTEKTIEYGRDLGHEKSQNSGYKVSKIEQKPLHKTEPQKSVEKPEPSKRSENRLPDSRRDSLPSKRESVINRKQDQIKPK